MRNLLLDKNRYRKLIYYLCILFAISFAFYPINRRLPVISIGFFTIGGLMISLFSPIILKEKKIILRKQHLFIFFLLIHAFFFLINPTGKSFQTLFRVVSVVFLHVVYINLGLTINLYQKMITVILSVSGAIYLVLIILHKFIYNSPFLSPFFYRTLSKDHKNQLSLFSAMFFCFVYNRALEKKKKIDILLMIIFLYATYYSNSRGGILIIGISICIFAILPVNVKSMKINTNSFSRGILASIVVFLLFFPSPIEKLISEFNKTHDIDSVVDFENADGDSKRKELFETGIRQTLQFPLGHGLQSFRRDFGGFASHNDYVQMLYELGIVGVGIFIAIVVFFYKTLFRLKKTQPREYTGIWNAHFVGLSVCLIFMLILNLYDTMMLWFILSGIEVLYRNERHRMLGKGNIS